VGCVGLSRAVLVGVSLTCFDENLLLSM